VAGLRRTYGSVVAVDRLDLEVRPGAIVGLVGANGAGKTTTLLCLAGALAPTAGTISIAGHDLAAEPLEARRCLGFVPDEPQLFDYLTVEEHLRFIGRLYHVDDTEARLPVLLGDLGLTDRRGALPAELSRGMRQKLALGCAFIHSPDVLLLDEPLTSLDPRAMRQMKDAILAHAARGAAVLLSSHQLPLVRELCTDVAVLRQGRVVAQAPPADLAAARAVGAGSLEDAVLDLLSE
jgi:ABC-2 type transport system ATP-binding protein